MGPCVDRLLAFVAGVAQAYGDWPTPAARRLSWIWRYVAPSLMGLLRSVEMGGWELVVALKAPDDDARGDALLLGEGPDCLGLKLPAATNAAYAAAGDQHVRVKRSASCSAWPSSSGSAPSTKSSRLRPREYGAPRGKG